MWRIDFRWAKRELQFSLLDSLYRAASHFRAKSVRASAHRHAHALFILRALVCVRRRRDVLLRSRQSNGIRLAAAQVVTLPPEVPLYTFSVCRGGNHCATAALSRSSRRSGSDFCQISKVRKLGINFPYYAQGIVPSPICAFNFYLLNTRTRFFPLHP